MFIFTDEDYVSYLIDKVSKLEKKLNTVLYNYNIIKGWINPGIIKMLKEDGYLMKEEI